MPERRAGDTPGPRERRSFPRPPLWLTLTLLFLGVAGLVFARHHRQRVSTEFADVIASQDRTPADLREMKEELAEMDLTREGLRRELEGRLKLAASLKSEDFYLSIDTRARKMRFYYGNTVLREAGVVVGETRTIEGPDKTWTFLPVKGAFPVAAKIVGHHWRVPEWVYVMNAQPVPPTRPVIENGLGQYVIVLQDGYVIHSPPSPDSPLQGAKPGSYMVPAADLQAIWERIHEGKTHVFVY